MAAKKKPEGNKAAEPGRGQVSFLVEPGTKVQITVDVGEKIVEGKVPLTLHIEQFAEEGHQAEERAQPEPKSVYVPVVTTGRLMAGFHFFIRRLKNYYIAAPLL